MKAETKRRVVLHGTWCPDEAQGQFVFWAEDIGGPLDSTRVCEAFNGILPDVPARSFFVTDARLPGTGNRPAASPDANPAVLTEERTLVETRLFHLPCGPAEAIRLLAGMADTPATGRALGPDLRFWRLVANWVLELAARRHFVPALTHEGTRLVGRWQPILNTEEVRLAQMARIMPPVARALGRAGQPPAPRHLVSSFASRGLDALIRQWAIAIPKPLRPSGPGVWDRWAASLGASPEDFESLQVKGPVRELQALESAVERWLVPVHTPLPPLRTAFRLTPPDDPEGPWLLQFGFQAPDEPALFVTASEIWREGGHKGVFHAREIAQPQITFLQSLGEAQEVFKKNSHAGLGDNLAAAIRVPRPDHAVLRIEEAHDFLANVAPVLESAEEKFGCILPSWWSPGKSRLGVRLTIKPMDDEPQKAGTGMLRAADAGAGIETMVRYDWDLALPDGALSAAEFQLLQAQQAPLRHVRGQWFEVRPEDLELTIQHWGRQAAHARTMELSKAMQLAFANPAASQSKGLPVLGVVGQGWLADMLGGDNQRIPTLPSPDGFNGTLRPYQLRGFSWLAFLTGQGLGVCLADDMGLGKTIQLLALLIHNRRTRARRRATLLVCPTSVLGNWWREIQRFTPGLTVHVHHGPDRKQGEALLAHVRDVDVVLTTYSIATRDRETLAAHTWDGVVLDEAQNIRNPDTQQAKAVCMLRSRYRVALTGTPVENRLAELWSLFQFLNPEYLGDKAFFKQRYSTPIERFRDPVASIRLRKLISPFILRRMKTDPFVIQDLPEKIEMKVYTNLTREQADLYRQTLAQMMDEIEQANGIARHGAVLRTLTRLKQVCNHPAQAVDEGEMPVLAGRSGKLSRLSDMLDEIVQIGDRALIFTQFVEMGHLLARHLKDQFGYQAVAFLHGGIPQRQRDEMVQRFQESPDGPPLFILSLKAGGLGLNLTRANHVFHFDRWWNPAVENQATDRAFRIGQKRNVQVHKFVCTGTMEERIDQLIESKKFLASSIVGTGERWLADMGTSELRELLALRDDAVEDEG
ncbi:MAG: DEAD/DEAH box helicase [Candidatus Sericytochromatia bacterium]|nr:DEAD/DEAH box helicase [Candidatus Sericytochromatia bacterium]